MSSKKPSTMKKEWRAAIKEAAFWKKQSGAYSAAILALADDNKELKEQLAMAIKGLPEWVKYERALKQIQVLLKDRERFVMMGMRSFAAVQQIVDEALPAEEHELPPTS